MTLPKAGYDVVIVGAGLAGLSAALTVAEFGLNPIVFEKSNKLGGATALSEGGFNAADSRRQIPLGIEDNPEKHFQQALKRSGYKGREALLRTLCYEAYSAQQWLETIGVQFDRHIYRAAGGLFPRTHKPLKGNGEAYIDALLHALKPFDVPVITEAEVQSLLRDSTTEGFNGPVKGVHGVCRGQTFTCRARCGVVLASGSFIRNQKMLTLYAPGLSNTKPWFEVGADGGILQAAADIGAGLVGMSYFELGFTTSSFCMPNDPSRFILVNRLGQRFVREDLQRTELLQAVLHQPEGVAWMISHAQEKRDPPASPEFEQLLLRALERFNEDVMLERPDPFGRDKRLMCVIQKPYCVSQLTPRLITSYGGVEIDANACVLDRHGLPIEGLTAAGDVTGGIHGEHALYGDLLASAAVFGRIAARTLVWSGRERPTGRRLNT
ncbi:MAG: FAD-dependent oxidoreductase [Sutterella wadsworthensis]|nr:FAD-dependent oxidoreductase [Sutterella wadsworthensis]